jgi:hypothetical protein
MEKQLSYLVSNKDLERKFKSNKSQIKIMVYSGLNQISNITDLLPSEISTCFILLRTSENSGHWTSISRHQNHIYYFDSYGVKPDGELSKIAPNQRYELGENSKALTRIISTIPKSFTFTFNKVQFQEYRSDVNTCGKWNMVFCKCVFLGMEMSEFQQRMKMLKNMYKCNYDDLVCVLWTAF